VNETTADAVLARQLIFDTGLREANVGLTRRNVFASQYALGDVRQTVILNVTIDYYNLLEDKNLVEVQTESVKRSQVALDVITAQFQAKLAAQVDTLQAQADLANARVALIQSQTAYDLAQAALKNSMGIVSAQQITLSAASAAQPDIAPDTRDLQTYVDTAFHNRLDVKEQQEVVNAAGYSVRIARINSGLTVNADVTEGYELNPASGQERTFTVDFSYPLFDAGSTRAALKASEAQLEEARRNLDQLEQNVHLQVEQGYDAREEARKNIVQANTAVQAAQANYDAALGKQQQGQINVLDVVTAEQQLLTAQVNQVAALFNYYIADAQLQRSIGVNDPTYIPRVPGAKPAQAALTGDTATVAISHTSVHSARSRRGSR
ncbi:MAG TPA: TolC family protein, partial [Chthonomonadales bacterium]|nr:TolC family protein [Chthonomonadales bacterium]